MVARGDFEDQIPSEELIQMARDQIPEMTLAEMVDSLLKDKTSSLTRKKKAI